jgi:hypothetical protein
MLRFALEWVADPARGTRIGPGVWDAIESLASELGEAPQAHAIRRALDPPESTTESIQEAEQLLAGRTIGIYTLTERAARGAKQLLQARFPDADVLINCDKVATEALKHLARTADIFVIGWQSAKHAATDAISRLRDPALTTVYAAGTGRSSLVRAVTDSLTA